MTRINLIDPSLLVDEHLRAEEREMVRIPNMILSGAISITDIPKKYTVRLESNPDGGKGHVKFFLNKLKFLHKRYEAVYDECIARGFNVTHKWPVKQLPDQLYNDYSPSHDAIKLNFARIVERFPKNAHLHSVKINKETYLHYVGDYNG